MHVLAGVASQYQVSKYPTLKLFRYGQLMKREYRGQRSVTSITSFVEDQLRDRLHVAADISDLDELDVSIIHIADNNSDIFRFI